VEEMCTGDERGKDSGGGLFSAGLVRKFDSFAGSDGGDNRGALALVTAALVAAVAVVVARVNALLDEIDTLPGDRTSGDMLPGGIGHTGVCKPIDNDVEREVEEEEFEGDDIGTAKFSESAKESGPGPGVVEDVDTSDDTTAGEGGMKALCPCPCPCVIARARVGLGFGVLGEPAG
jgi:hypothetical protein